MTTTTPPSLDTALAAARQLLADRAALLGPYEAILASGDTAELARIDEGRADIGERAETALADLVAALDAAGPADGDGDYPRSTCGCGFTIILTEDGWQHDAAPYLWGDDHDARPTADKDGHR